MYDLDTMRAMNKRSVNKQRDKSRETLRAGGVVNIWVGSVLTPCLTLERYNEHCEDIDRGWDLHVEKSQEIMQALWERTPGAKSATA